MNIILIVSDQQRADSIACYGNVFVDTPNLDRLASDGVRFNHFFSTFPVCTPARATMWTGVFAHTHRVIHNRYGIDDVYEYEGNVERTIFETLQERGVTTAYFGKWHLGEKNSGRFDVWQGFNSHGGHWHGGLGSGDQYKPEWETDRSIEFLKSELAQEKPFVMVQGYYPPHNPYTAPERFMNKYRGKGIPFPGYYAHVEALDQQVGRLLDTLDDTGLAEDTVVIYFSDHGETFNYREFLPHKYVCYDEAIRVPLIVGFPGNKNPGLVVDELTGMEDLAPTIMDIAGVNHPEPMHGSSLMPLARKQKTDWRDVQYVQCEVRTSRTQQRCIRSKRWKLILSADEKHKLFDLESDPEEELNLFDVPFADKHRLFENAKDHTAIVLTTAEQLRQYAAKLDDPTGVELAEIVIRQKTRSSKKGSAKSND